MWPFRSEYHKMSDEIRTVIWAIPPGDPSRHCRLVGQVLYPGEAHLLDHQVGSQVRLFQENPTQLIVNCDVLSNQGILLSSAILLPFLEGSRLNPLLQRCDLPVDHHVFQVVLISKMIVNLLFTSGTPSTTFRLTVEMNRKGSYEDFVCALLGHTAFQSTWKTTYHRLRTRGYHLPADFELYYIPRGCPQGLVSMLSTLVNSGVQGIDLSDVLRVSTGRGTPR
jgi:hypothetical protein